MKTLTKKQIEFLNEYTRGSWSWQFNPKTGEVDLHDDFCCNGKNLKSLAGIKFGKVNGSFDCGHNQLTSLEGAPKKVRGDFYCHNNKLTSLEGAPQKVGRSFSCCYNKLTSLEGAPQKVGRSFLCHNNKLTSLEGAPQEVGMTFQCSHNKLTSLEGAPQEVGWYFDCGAFRLMKEEWNLAGWLRILEGGHSIILTLPYLSEDDVQLYELGLL